MSLAVQICSWLVMGLCVGSAAHGLFARRYREPVFIPLAICALGAFTAGYVTLAGAHEERLSLAASVVGAGALFGVWRIVSRWPVTDLRAN